jgi:hypothetical protein
MVLRGMAVRTRESYTAAVKGLVRYYYRSPDRLDEAEVQRYALNEWLAEHPSKGRAKRFNLISATGGR